MAKQSGLSDQLFIQGFDLSGDVGSIETISARTAQLLVTSINKAAVERISGQDDGEISFTTFFNDATLAGGATDQEHLVLAAKGSGADRVVSYFHGSAIGNTAAALVSKQINYDMTRPQDGSLNFTVQCLGNKYGLNHCVQLTPGIRTDITATDGDELDNGAASANGLVAYLQIFAFTGTSVVVAVEESSDNGGSDAYAAILSFTSATGITAERKATALAAAVEQYLMVSTTGTFTDLDFAVCASRDLYAD